MIKKNYIINPDIYLKPDFKISPFEKKDIKSNIKILSMNNIENKKKFKKFFSNQLKDNQNYIVTRNARNAIFKALVSLNLKITDEVAILTSTNNFYISSCVTKEIEKICSWSREITNKTKVIFVNHEFGMCYENLEELRKYNLPIIEDCAHSFNSNNSSLTKGTVGDFVIYSLPKYFPVQIGGILKYSLDYEMREEILEEEKEYLEMIIGNYLDDINLWAEKRRQNHNYLEAKLKKLGYESRFSLKKGFVPGVYLFKNSKNIDLNKLKEFLWKQGIECSVFYGENTFFIPVAHNLEEEDLDYFVEVIKYFEGVQ
ncbi:MAG: DegT/DnrJ/EryC1/StrS family aminotransferase [Cetobacterium sp.]